MCDSDWLMLILGAAVCRLNYTPIGVGTVLSHATFGKHRLLHIHSDTHMEKKRERLKQNEKLTADSYVIPLSMGD